MRLRTVKIRVCLGNLLVQILSLAARLELLVFEGFLECLLLFLNLLEDFRKLSYFHLPDSLL